jgi:hypothetical protein
MVPCITAGGFDNIFLECSDSDAEINFISILCFYSMPYATGIRPIMPFRAKQQKPIATITTHCYSANFPVELKRDVSDMQ